MKFMTDEKRWLFLLVQVATLRGQQDRKQLLTKLERWVQEDKDLKDELNPLMDYEEVSNEEIPF